MTNRDTSISGPAGSSASTARPRSAAGGPAWAASALHGPRAHSVGSEPVAVGQEEGFGHAWRTG